MAIISFLKVLIRNSSTKQKQKRKKGKKNQKDGHAIQVETNKIIHLDIHFAPERFKLALSTVVDIRFKRIPQIGSTGRNTNEDSQLWRRNESVTKIFWILMMAWEQRIIVMNGFYRVNRYFYFYFYFLDFFVSLAYSILTNWRRRVDRQAIRTDCVRLEAIMASLQYRKRCKLKEIGLL